MKTLPILLLCLIYLGVQAQQTPPSTTTTSPADSTRYNKDTYPGAVKFLPVVTPKSPNAAALGRYGDYPVSLYTGLPTIEIPIHEFRVGELTVPIKLSYHASGIRVSDRPSWVGLGWSLQTGGAITRTVQSRPDEELAQSKRLIKRLVDDPSTFYNPNCPSDTSTYRMNTLGVNDVDSQRDLFAYRTPTGGNTFMLTPPPTALDSIPGFLLLRPEPVQIASTTSLTSFTLTDTDGTRYRYADRETTYTNPQGANPFTNYTSSWNLSEIVSPTNNDRATYAYTTPIQVNSAPDPVYTWIVQGELNETGSANDSGVSTGITSQTNRDDGGTVDARYLSEIAFPGGTLQFISKVQRRADGGLVLDYIDLFSYQVSNSQPGRIKRFVFHYTNQDGTPNPVGNFLRAVQMLEGTTLTPIGSYSFAYNQTSLPEPASRAKDYWGFYNGQTGTTLIPQQTFTFQERTNTSTLTSVTIGNANRLPNETLMKAGILTTISYPTGGYTTFDFETNRYLDNGIVRLSGGLRVSRISTYTTPARLANRRVYRYGVNESGNGTQRSFVNTTYTSTLLLNYYQPAGTSVPKPYSYRSWVFSSVPSTPLTPDEGSPVTYAEVAEYQQDSLGNNQGKTIHTYRDQAQDSYLQMNGGRGFLTSRSWDRGQPVRQDQYDTNGFLRTRTAYQNVTLAGGQYAITAGILVSLQEQQIGNKASLLGSPCNFVDDRFLPSQSYRFSYGLTKPVSTSIYTYDDDNSGRYTLKVDETDYATGFYLPRQTRSLVEAGVIRGTEYYYPTDYGTISPSATTPELQGIRALQQRNRYIPVETVSFRKASASDAATYQTGSLTSFTALTLNGLPTALPLRVYQLETTPGSFTTGGAFMASAYRSVGTGNTFSIDPRYAIRLTVNTYDTYGNLTAYTESDGPKTAFTYQTYTPGNSIPANAVRFSLINTQTTNVGLSTAQTTTYTYEKPLLGPATIVSPNGLTTRYTYDNFGRLQTISDQTGRIYKRYTYRYTTQP